MHRYFSCLLTTLLFSCFSSFSQILTVSPSVLNFPVLNEKQVDSLSFTVTSTYDQGVNIQILQPFRVFKSNPYWVNDTIIYLAANASKTVVVYCKISHNTANPANLILRVMSNDRVSDQFVKLTCQGKYSRIYYSTTQNLSEEALKQALKTKLSQNVNALSYDGAREEMYSQIDNNNDSVTCVYTNRKAKFNTTGSGQNGSNTANFNCEHTFPQGFFSQGLPMRSDIHHLFSTDEDANNSRGNLPFGIAKAPIDAIAINAPSKRGGGRYEPQDSHKGNCARAMMYFVLRYQDYQNFYGSAKQDSIFRVWNFGFLPKPKDTIRNAMVFATQNNRNPFVDYPQFSNRMKNLVGVSVSDSVRKIGISRERFMYYGGSGLPTSLVVWNEGNKRINISNIRFVSNIPLFLNNSNQNFTLAYNEAKAISFENSSQAQDFDTLIFETDAPGFGTIRVPANKILISNKEQSFLQVPHIFPNPGTNTTYIDNLETNNQLVTIEIMNIQGKLLKDIKEAANSGKTKLNVEDLPPGIYQIRVKQSNRVDQIRFAIE